MASLNSIAITWILVGFHELFTDIMLNVDFLLSKVSGNHILFLGENFFLKLNVFVSVYTRVFGEGARLEKYATEAQRMRNHFSYTFPQPHICALFREE